MKAGKRIVSGLMIAVTVLVFLGLTAASSRAVVEITPDRIHTGAAVGTLLAIDTPYNPSAPDPADIGWAMVISAGNNNNSGGYCWEPDGTVYNANGVQRWVAAGATITWTFDLPDGAVIKSVYASWTGTINGSIYSYSEAASDSFSLSSSGPAGDLKLNWTDSIGTVRIAWFTRLPFSDITVAGGDGFKLTTVVPSNYFWSDAVVVDYVVAPPATPGTLIYGK